MTRFVVIGAGQAGLQAAEALRAGGFDGELLLLGEEPYAPYHRPPLSKAWLGGQMDAAQLTQRAPEMLARKRIDLRTGVRVAAIDRAARQLRLADGGTLAYDGLVLATGARARRLPLPGSDAANVHVLRGRDDADALAASLARLAEQGLPLVVVGGGFVGLEVAATARQRGLAVTVVEALPRLLARSVAPPLADWLAALHRRQGVELRLGTGVEGFECGADGRVAALRLADGQRLPAGAVLLGVGAEPDDRLARAAGLACDRGILVDDQGRTDDPAIVAAGDCTVRRCADGRLLRLESVQGATEGAKAAAASLLGAARPFTATPWFWSDQFGHKLQLCGLGAGADLSVTRGDPASGGACAWWHYREGRLVAVDTVDLPREHLLARRWLDAGLTPEPAVLADAAADLATAVPVAA